MRNNTIESNSKITFSSLAKEIGVTTSVVSRVLKNTSTTIAIGQNTKRKILDIAWERGYRLNNNIGFMATTKNMSVDLHYYPVTTGILERCATLNLGIFSSSFDDDNAMIPEFLLKREVSGMIFLGKIPSNIETYLYAEKIPYVVINPYSITQMEKDCVLFNDYETMTNLLEYLNGNGYKEYICISYDDDTNYSKKIAESFKNFLNASSHKGALLLSKSSGETELFDRIKDLINSASSDTVFIALSRLFTMKILEYIAIQDKKIPDDLGIVGNNLLADYYIPKLTTVFYPFYESGVVAVDAIIEKWENKVFSVKPKTVRGKLIKNTSTKRGKTE